MEHLNSQNVLIAITALFVFAVLVLNIIDRPKLWAWFRNETRTRKMWQKAGFYTTKEGRFYVTPDYNRPNKAEPETVTSK